MLGFLYTFMMALIQNRNIAAYFLYAYTISHHPLRKKKKIAFYTKL